MTVAQATFTQVFRPVTAALNSAFGTFSPKSLFSAGEQGVWYDPSDLTTLFQGAAGTTPVTGVEQPVGLMLDKSKGLALGSELVTNGDFSNGTTGWTGYPTGTISATISVVNGRGRVTNTSTTEGRAYQTFSGLTVGKFYLITCDAFVGTASVSIGWTSDSATTGGNSVGSTSDGKLTLRAQATATTMYLRLVANTAGLGNYAEFDNISVRELPGNHAYQSTSANRPTLSARVNLLTKTEQFDDAYWAKANVSTLQKGITDPNGGTNAWEAIGTSVNIFSSNFTQTGSTKFVIWLKKRTSSTCEFYRYSYSLVGFQARASINFDTGVVTDIVGSGATAENVGNGWYKCSLTVGATTNTNVGLVYNTNDVYFWHPDLRVSNDGVGLPSYQRVNSATDYDTTGFPLYLAFNGSSSAMLTNTITPGTDKAQVFAGVRKLSDLSGSFPIELSSNYGGTDGTFALNAPSGNLGDFGFGLRGTTTAYYLPSPYAAPTTKVLSMQLDISASTQQTEIIPRINGVIAQSGGTTGGAGTGSFGNYPLYIGARGGTSLWFNGRIYSMIVRFGSNLTTAQITNTEKYVNSKTKAY